VVIPDPTVCFGDIEYEPNTHEYPIVYDKLRKGLENNNIETFIDGVGQLHKEIKSDEQVQKQLTSAINGFTLKDKSKNIKYSGPKTFDDLGYYTTTIDTDSLVKCLEKDIDDLKKRNPVRYILNLILFKNRMKLQILTYTSVILTIHSMNTFKETNVINQRINCTHYT